MRTAGIFSRRRRALCDGTPTGFRGAGGGYRRCLRGLVLALGLASFAAINQSAIAQTTPAGPVHYPALASSAPGPDATNAMLAPVAPAISAPANGNGVQAPAVTGDIHDIRGPISIPYEWLWAAYTLAALALAGMLYAAWRFLRRKRATVKQPFEIALEKLEAARGLMRVETVREYAFTVSEIIRGYIEQRFGEKAARRTTEEFLSDLLAQTGTPLARHRSLLEDFLNHCDLIKFARWGATDRELESMHESARAFILDTRPQPDAAQKAAKPVPAPPAELAPAK